MKKGNIAIFIPHNGCPQNCIFCNQHTITGQNSCAPSAKDVKVILDKASQQNNKSLSIAFFGGSFTAINHDYMISLLEATKPYIDEGIFDGIRISTRPDAISQEILDILKEYNVNAIELGAQSTDNTVLKMNRRGHTYEDIINASILIKQNSISLGHQMMVGMYGSTREKTIKTAKQLADLKPDTMRIYPVIVLKGTELEEIKSQGLYIPLEQKEAIDITAELLLYFDKQGIEIIKVGLHASEGIEAGFVAGPYHQAFRELCEGKVLCDKIKDSLKNKDEESEVFINPRSLSKLIGHNGIYIKELEDAGIKIKLMSDESLNPLEIKTQ
jgi:histone acetyltransferase (RNA polymerase elongator complex component)